MHKMNSILTEVMLEDANDGALIPDEPDIAMANKVMAKGLLKLEHGDAVHWLGQGFRHANLLFWHEAEGFIKPEWLGGEYAFVPRCFPIGQFKPDHWLTDCNEYGIGVYLTKELQDLIRKCGSLTIQGTTYVVEGDLRQPLDYVEVVKGNIIYTWIR